MFAFFLGPQPPFLISLRFHPGCWIPFLRPRQQPVQRGCQEQELLGRGEARGHVREYRGNLRMLLEERFGPVPEALAQQIEALEDLERLRALFRRALQINSLSELRL